MPNPLLKFYRAFIKLRQTVSSSDVVVFETTELEDIWTAAEAIEKTQRSGRDICNMARIRPFLEALGKFSSALDTLCNGTPYLPWV
jgi:hypothetical protein